MVRELYCQTEKNPANLGFACKEKLHSSELTWKQKSKTNLELGLPMMQDTDNSNPLDRPNTSTSSFLEEMVHEIESNTFLSVPYLEDIHQINQYDLAIVGIPYHSGDRELDETHLAPQGIRHVSNFYRFSGLGKDINFSDLINICDLGDILTIQNDRKKSFQLISEGVNYILDSGVFPVFLSGNCSVSSPVLRGINNHLHDRKVGIIHFDRYVYSQLIDVQSGKYICPYHNNKFYNQASNNFVQLGVNSFVRSAQEFQFDRNIIDNILTVTDIAQIGLDASVDFALERALQDAQNIYISFDLNCIDANYCSDRECSETGELLPREIFYILKKLINHAPICGLEVVGVSPPSDVGNLTAIMATRIICNTIIDLVSSGQLPKKKRLAS